MTDVSRQRTHLVLHVLEKLGTNLFGNNLSPGKVFFHKAEPNLFQNKISLFSFVHGAVGLHLELLENVTGLGGIALGLFDLRKSSRETRPLNFDKDLSCDFDEYTSPIFMKFNGLWF
jgi:hypothetical protein